MKIFDNLYEDIISLPNLYRAFEKASKGKRIFRVYSFKKNLHENLWKLHCELKSKEYKMKPYFTFYVTDYRRER
jgi:hypothetical protein